MIESIFDLLRKRYEPPAWAFLEEVRNGTGYSRGPRTADALAMSLWPSRGLHLHGFEVKVDRGDWLKELREPSKAEEIARFCHFWHLVIDDQKIVQNGEVPATWGLLVRDGKKLKCEREATLNKDALPPTHAFLGAILRKVCSTQTDAARLAQARSEGHTEGYKEGLNKGGQTSDAYKLPFEKLRDQVQKFENESGVSISGYNFGRVAATVRLLSEGWESPIAGLEGLISRAREIETRAEEALAEAKARVLPFQARTGQAK